eukprot:352594-Chlamydomonas_euryale.AAC.14
MARARGPPQPPQPLRARRARRTGADARPRMHTTPSLRPETACAARLTTHATYAAAVGSAPLARRASMGISPARPGGPTRLAAAGSQCWRTCTREHPAAGARAYAPRRREAAWRCLCVSPGLTCGEAGDVSNRCSQQAGHPVLGPGSGPGHQPSCPAGCLQVHMTYSVWRGTELGIGVRMRCEATGWCAYCDDAWSSAVAL